MARVMYCTMEEPELNLAVEIAERMQIDLYPYLVEKDDNTHCQELVEDAYEKNVDAILCRGRILAFLRNINCIIPIVPNYFAGKETMAILWSIKQYYQQQGSMPDNQKVCLLSHQPLFINEKMYSDVFGMEVHNVVVPDSRLNDMEQFLREIKQQGYTNLACGRSILPIAESVGLKAFCDFFSTAEDAICDGLRTASVVALSAEELKHNTRNVRTMMDNAFEAILLVDAEGKLTLMNRQAEMRLKLENQSCTGRYIWEVVPQLSRENILNVLETGNNIFGDIIEMESFSAVVNVSAIHNHTYNTTRGAIVQFTEMQKIEQMSEVIKKELYAKGHVAKYHFEDILGQSQAIEETKQFANQFAKYNSNVLILGETGIGKEVFAQSIHNASLRSNKPFVAINCGAIPPNLLESELFGYVDGAFTGALRKGKKGLLEIADGGTVFLDEVSEMDLGGQVRLLRVLEERTIHKVGDDKMIPINIRVIAASNRNLRKYVEEGKFREDLYYRLNVLTLNLPPLRRRGRDIILLANSFFDHYGKKYHKLISLTPEAQKVVCSYSWPGNVRQLRNFCERLVVVANSSVLDKTFVAKQLEDSFMLSHEEVDGSENETMESKSEPMVHAEETWEAAGSASGPEAAQGEKERILEALNRFAGNRKAAGQFLGMSKSTLWRKMKKYEIEEKF